MSFIYIIAAACSLLALVAYSIFIKKKHPWFWVLFAAITVVNTGYYALSISKSVDMSIWANRVSYLGSVFLPVAMLLIILDATHLNHPKRLWWMLVGLGVPVFLIAASYPYSDIYYKSVELITVNGVSVLEKVYGTWHSFYMVYLIGYFAVMIAVVIHATKIKKLTSAPQSIMLLGSVFVNICVWAIEQFVDIEFEFLAISYIITELFLIGVYALVQDTERRIALVREQFSLNQSVESEKADGKPQFSNQTIEMFQEGLNTLTQTEKLIYDLYLLGKSTKEVLEEMNIKENTLKYHNKNIYGKLGVNSRKELKAIANYTNQ